MALDWIPETYPASGGLAAKGFYKLLGRPRLDPLAVLVRETAQNSWDARLKEGVPVEFSIAGWDLLPSEQKALRGVFPKASKAGGTGLDDALSRDELRAIYVSDRKTMGLGGPFEASESNPDDVYDWVDFVLNVGKENTAGHTGGTYGFGKTITYIVSSVRSIVIHSRTMHKGKPQSRLIACAIGDDFTLGRKLYTGRHWWGTSAKGMPRPVTGSGADRVAETIGMPPFEGSDLGTNILILEPEFGGRSPVQAMNFIAESVLWHLWPKLVSRGTKIPMKIDVSWNGEQIKIPRPEDRPPLHGFAQAFRALLEGSEHPAEALGTKITEIRCQRPIAYIGDLATVQLVKRERAEVDDRSEVSGAEEPPAAMITGSSHHVALLRTPELVVEYLEGPAPVEGGIEWAGVFRCKADHDSKFAAAEPPTHDSWNPQSMAKGPDKTIVNVALREIQSALYNEWAPRPEIETPEAFSTAAVANDLGHLIRGVGGQGPGRQPSSGSSGTGKTNARVEQIGAGPIRFDGAIATRAEIKIYPRRDSAGTRLRIVCGAALDGTQIDPELDPLLGLVQASWNGTVLELAGTSENIDFLHEDPLELEVVVTRSPGSTVLFDFQVEPIEVE